MERYYFTYGTEGYPFCGGWTEVVAPDRHAACTAFRAFHRDKTPGQLNCSSVYNQVFFERSTMFGPDGNFGCRCQEIITITRTVTCVKKKQIKKGGKSNRENPEACP